MKESESRIAGGAATGGGINFQAAVTAIAYTYTLRGRRLGWLSGLQEDVPVSVAAETGSGGDDIRMTLRDGKRCDVQAKRGLRRGGDLWASLLAMGTAIVCGRIDFGVLAVSSSSSGTIREDLANAIFRIGDGRTDNLPEIAETFLTKLTAAGLSPAQVCRALRIVTLSAATHDGASIAAAQAELGHVCRDTVRIGDAWNSLYRDAVELIDRRGRREASSLVRLLKADAVALVDDVTSPASLLSRLAEWTISTNATFQIFGVRRPLRIDKAWIPLHAVVREERVRHPDPLTELAAYQSWHEREYSHASTVDPETLGRFVKLGVLVAGPGMGKTTLLGRIARAYANDGIPVLRVRLAAVAARMSSGETFEEAVFALGLAGSTISPVLARAAGIPDWVLLCDGLDETGAAQTQIASAAERFTAGHPECRVIVTTRPVGYHAADFEAWRHYDIVPLERRSADRDLERLLVEIGGEDSELAQDAERIASKELEEDATAKAVARSPLLLALSASVIARGGPLGGSRHRLYERLFALVDEAPNSRIPQPPAESAILRRFLDILGWQTVSDPIASVDAALEKCAYILVEDLGWKPLACRAAAESYLRYWQDVGLVERIGLQGSEALTFLHKTFGEFAAARFLVAMPAAQRTDTLASIRDDETWNETLGFAAMMGIAEDVCDILMHGITFDRAGIAQAVRCLEILGEAESAPAAPIRKAVFAYAIEAMRSPRRRWATEIGIAAWPATRRFPDEIAPSCAALVSHPQSWTRLAGWASLVAAGPPYLDLERLQSAILQEPPLADESMRSGHGGGMVLGSDTECDLARALVLAGARQLLKHRPGKATDDAVVAACRIESLGSIEFLQRASRLLAEFGITEKVWPPNLEKSVSSLLHPGVDFVRAQRKAHEAIFDAICHSGNEFEAPSSEGPKLLNLSAFLYATGYMTLPIRDIWKWQEPFDPEPVRETLRAAVAASGIPRDALQHEAHIARRALAEPYGTGRVLQYVANVDAAPMDWNAARADLGKIEAALYHRSAWIVWIAAHLVEVLLQEAELRDVVLRAIADGRGDTLWAAAGLAVDLDKAAMVQAIYDRLGRDISYGCDHLLLALPNLDAPADARLLAAMETGFLRGTLKTAMAAGHLAARYASTSTTGMLTILDTAAAYWKAHEEPYPVNGGIVPESPRAKIVEAMAAIRAPTYDVAKTYVADTRSDVRDIGGKALVVLLGEQPGLASTFLDDVDIGALPSHLLDTALKGGVAWEAKNFDHVRAYLDSPRADLRYAAMSVLQHQYSPVDFIRSKAAAMTADPDRETKERAYRILDTLPSAK